MSSPSSTTDVWCYIKNIFLKKNKLNWQSYVFDWTRSSVLYKQHILQVRVKKNVWWIPLLVSVCLNKLQTYFNIYKIKVLKVMLKVKTCTQQHT